MASAYVINMQNAKGVKMFEGHSDVSQLEKTLMSRLPAKEIRKWIQKYSTPYRELMSYYKCAMMEIETKFKVLNEQFSIQYDRNPIDTIETRVKSPESIIGKLKRRNLPVTIKSMEENLFDIAGVRVICSFLEDIYMISECLLSQNDVTLVQRKDYIKSPKESGYRSLHLIVSVPIFLKNEKKEMKVEVQLRTIAMDFWASLEHKLRYKKTIPPQVVSELSEELAECARQNSELDQRMQTVREKIHSFEQR